MVGEVFSFIDIFKDHNFMSKRSQSKRKKTEKNNVITIDGVQNPTLIVFVAAIRFSPTEVGS